MPGVPIIFYKYFNGFIFRQVPTTDFKRVFIIVICIISLYNSVRVLAIAVNAVLKLSRSWILFFQLGWLLLIYLDFAVFHPFAVFWSSLQPRISFLPLLPLGYHPNFISFLPSRSLSKPLKSLTLRKTIVLIFTPAV